ncbi:MAG: hypothetical protein WBA51_04995 [Erythrobacter sp.]
MSGKILLAAIVIISIAGNLFFYSQPCYFYSCARVHDVFVISESAEKRELAASAIRQARQLSSKLFTPPEVKGAMLLDGGVTEPNVIRFQTDWVMRYDPLGTQTLDRLLSEAEASRGTKVLESEGIQVAVLRRGPAHALGKDEVDTASHEICHFLFRISMSGAEFSDAIGEIGAIACESDELIKSRVDHFKAIAATTGPINWDTFLVGRHPIKRRAELSDLISASTARAESSFKFNVDSEAPLGQEIGLFYTQSAVFVAFWRKECSSRDVLKKIARAAARDIAFSQWLEKANLDCGVNNIIEFEKAIESMISEI